MQVSGAGEGDGGGGGVTTGFSATPILTVDGCSASSNRKFTRYALLGSSLIEATITYKDSFR